MRRILTYVVTAFLKQILRVGCTAAERVVCPTGRLFIGRGSAAVTLELISDLTISAAAILHFSQVDDQGLLLYLFLLQ